MQTVLDIFDIAVRVPLGLAVAALIAAVLCGVLIGRLRRPTAKAETFLQSELIRVQRMNADLKSQRDKLKSEAERSRRRAKMPHRNMAV